MLYCILLYCIGWLPQRPGGQYCWWLSAPLCTDPTLSVTVLYRVLAEAGRSVLPVEAGGTALLFAQIPHSMWLCCLGRLAEAGRSVLLVEAGGSALLFAQIPHSMWWLYCIGRLAEAGRSVLLVEAGGSAPLFAQIPLNVASLQRSALDWRYQTVPQEGVMAGTGG
jgi:choline dehydrogenase-like flavoprotein